MKYIAALVISVPMLLAQNERAANSVTAVRSWSLGDVTRIAIEVSGDFEFRTDRLHNPERVYFDILNARPRIENRRIFGRDLGDPIVQRVRAAETTPGVTRVVLDLSGPCDISTSQLSNPNRLMIELRASKTPPVTPTESATTTQPPLKDPAPLKPAPPIRAEAAPIVPAVESSPEPRMPVSAPAPVPAANIGSSASRISPPPPAVEPVRSVDPPRTVASAPAPLPNSTATSPEGTRPPRRSTADLAAVTSPEVGKAARHTSTGGSSLTRALGLKVGRIVIDPGHGGHDQGTQGAKGLVEKDLVLDVAQRLGKLIEERMNTEVVYTRTDDTFIPLEGRTALANEKKADLFLSIHANSSPIPRIAGVETFYLNFTDSKEALDVASRENASSQKSIYELQDIIHKITLHEKLDESKEFATRIQSALFTFTSRNVPNERNRGIKKAPFVVLIGANMPSVLAEIGFLTNSREEAQLKKPDYRQKLAEALYRGVSRYAESLSHFQLATNQE
jgi:N-acetylmuramoyl-L-alanine amidase